MRHLKFLDSRVYELGQSGTGSVSNWLLAFTERHHESKALKFPIKISYRRNG